MKKNVFLIAALFAFGMSNAQEEASSPKTTKFGIKSGVNISSINGISSPVTGFHIGGLFEYKFTEKFSIQPELLYSMEGGKEEYNDSAFGTAYHYSQKVKLNNINLPIMFKYYPVEGFSIEAGPQIGVIVASNNKAELFVPESNIAGRTDYSMDEDHTVIVVANPDGSLDATVIDHDYKLKKVNFGVNFGAGYELKNGLFFQARYNLGLTDFTENANVLSGKVSGTIMPIVPNHEGEKLKVSNIQISLGYKF